MSAACEAHEKYDTDDEARVIIMVIEETSFLILLHDETLSIERKNNKTKTQRTNLIYHQEHIQLAMKGILHCISNLISIYTTYLWSVISTNFKELLSSAVKCLAGFSNFQRKYRLESYIRFTRERSSHVSFNFSNYFERKPAISFLVPERPGGIQ